MKKFIVSNILCCLALCSFAQEHLSFKGIPITGSMTSFCQKLEAKGFVQTGIESNVHMFKGDFTGKQVTVGAVATNNGQDVYMVTVFFDTSDSWKTLVSTYEHYKDLYTEKYGNPTLCVENNPSRSDSNTSLMHELFQGRVTYACIFDVSGGAILLSIEKEDINEGYVIIKYEDAQNAQSKRKRDLDEI